mgnify:CR=1 FL=1
MEKWKFGHAYGAAHVLHEILTIKSDDVVGRVKVYESLVKGKTVNQAGVPESFRVLIKEFQALGLNIQILDNENHLLDLKDIEEEEEKEDTIRIDEIDMNPPSEPEEPIEETTQDEEELLDEEDEFEEDDLDHLEFPGDLESDLEEGDDL